MGTKPATLVLLMCIASCCFFASASVTDIAPRDIYKLLASDNSTFLVDVRTGELISFLHEDWGRTSKVD